MAQIREREARAAVEAAVPTVDTPVISCATRVKPTNANVSHEHVVIDQESGIQGRV